MKTLPLTIYVDRTIKIIFVNIILSEWLGFREPVKLRDYLRIGEIQTLIENNPQTFNCRNTHKIKQERKRLLNEKWKEIKFNCDDVKNLKEINNLPNKFLEVSNKVLNDLNYSLKKKGKNPLLECFRYKDEVCFKTYQYAAELQLGEYKILIEPRDLMDVNGYKEMLRYVFSINSLDEISGINERNEFIELYYLVFLKKLKTILDRRLYSTYVEMKENLPYVRGRILITDHIRVNRFSNEKIYCEFSDLSTNNLINQIILYTLSRILRTIGSSSDLIFSKAMSLFNRLQSESVSLNPSITIHSILNIRYNRQNIMYKEIMQYCYNILKSTGGVFSTKSDAEYAAYYVDMNELFEQYVGKKLQDKGFMDNDPLNNLVSGLQLQANNWDIKLQDDEKYIVDESKLFNIRPDIVISTYNEGNEERIICDTKYKHVIDDRSRNYNVQQQDIYQILSYARKYNAQKIALIYPKHRDLNIENGHPYWKEWHIEENLTLYIFLVNLFLPENEN